MLSSKALVRVVCIRALPAYAALAFAACSGGSGLTPTPIAVGANSVTHSVTLSKVSNAALRGEVLNAQQVIFTKDCGDGGKTKFTVSGKAIGPYPGTFTAHGRWKWNPHYLSLNWHSAAYSSDSWSFAERFKITSGTSTIFGSIHGYGGEPVLTCATFRANKSADLHYLQNGSAVGPATVNISAGFLKESLL
jgi:hypothetical protein